MFFVIFVLVLVVVVVFGFRAVDFSPLLCPLFEIGVIQQLFQLNNFEITELTVISQILN